MKIKAYAKINLLLDILSKLPDGYHNIFSVMQSVDLYDTVFVNRTESGEIRIICEKQGVPTDESNTAYKGAEAFFKFTGKENTGLEIVIEKRIPHAAGLAGGSADAAAVIKALDMIFDTKLSFRDFVSIGLEVGADVPFCIIGGTCLCQHTGGVISPLPQLPECYILIVKPVQSVNTKEAYRVYDEIADYVRHPDDLGVLQAITEGDLNKTCSLCNNVFEQAVEVYNRAYIKGIMNSDDALASCMSGSGPSVFGIFDNKGKALSAYGRIKAQGEEVYLCKPSECGCEIID